MNEYIVWFDLFMNDYFVINKTEMSQSFKKQLETENIKTFNVTAESSIEAINVKFPKELRKIENNTIH